MLTASLRRVIALLTVTLGTAATALPVLATAELDPIAPRLATADAKRGAQLFLQCKACHVSTPDAAATVGPNLWNIVDRPVGGADGYAYSDALKGLGGQWDYETLSRYLFDPAAVAPGTRMVFGGVKRAEDRADLIAHLRSLSPEPVPLPPVATLAEAAPRYGGLPDGEGRAAVYFTCRACHGIDQFRERHFPRADWDALLTKMIQEKGMAAPEPWARKVMVDYLSTHFGLEQEDNWAGLPAGPGREDVFYGCTGCHSLMIVTQQSMSRSRWDDTLLWMVEEQGMSDFDDAATRERVLDYLATHFGG